MLANRTLVLSAVTMGLLEAIDAFFIEFPPAAIVFAVGFLGGTVWLVRRRGVGAPIWLGVLFGTEIAAVPFLSRPTVADWVLQTVVIVICVTGLMAAAAVTAQRRRQHATSAAAKLA